MFRRAGLIGILFLSVAAYNAAPFTRVFSGVPERQLHNADTCGDGCYTIKDTSCEGCSSGESDFFFSFNGPSESMRRDDTGRFQVLRSSYRHYSGDDALGGGAAFFMKKEHGLQFHVHRNTLIGACGETGSFTLVFRIHPKSLRNGAKIFTRTGYATTRPQGIRVFFENGHLVAAFDSMFLRDDGIMTSARLVSHEILQSSNWYHVAVSYDSRTGRLWQEINGRQSASLFMTKTGRPREGVQPAAFGHRDLSGSWVCLDSPVVEIGNGYSGILDELRMSRYSLAELKSRNASSQNPWYPVKSAGRLPRNAEGIVTGSVYELPATGTRINLFTWDENLPEDTHIWMEFRISDSKFSINDAAPKWYRVTRNQRGIYMKRGSDGVLLRGRYMQWRAHLVPSPIGDRSPRLSNVRIHYQQDFPPRTPTLLQVVATGNNSVTLRWKKNVEADLGGYRIYYGTVPGRYDGVIDTVRGTALNNSMEREGRITATITNSIIDENRTNDPRGVLTFPLLRNNVLYYFAVSAYDNYRPGTSYRHESDLSDVVKGRPLAGSDITPAGP